MIVTTGVEPQSSTHTADMKRIETMIRKALWSAGGAAVLLATAPAFAQTANVTIDFKIDVIDGCSITTGGGAPALLDFGTTQGGLSTTAIDAQTAAGNITVLCNAASAAATFSIGPGKNDFGSQRNLNNPLIVGPAGNIAYRLFHNPARTMEYLPDQKIPISQPILAGVPFELTIYGRVEGGQNLLAGGYTDQATGTLAL